MSKPVIVVGGPTASGKSSLSLAIAERIGGEIVNADSMQVYRDLEIVTARPGRAEAARVAHHLYGVFGLDERCSAGTWRGAALDVIENCHAAGSVPVLVGGTGLYLRALMTGLHRMPAVPRDIRDRLNRRAETEGAGALHVELAAVDPDMARRLSPSDGQRIVRALEIFEHTGRTLTDWQAGETEDPPAGFRYLTIVTAPPREELYADIDLRFERMVDEGAVEEVEQLLASGPLDDFPLLKAVGVPPIRAYLDGDIDRVRMIELGKRDTRRYAKRQGTWFRHQIVPDIVINTKYSESDMDNFFPEISNFLLTG